MKKKEEKLFVPDFTKKLFSIKINVYENGSEFMIETENGSAYKPEQNQVIGALEISKIGVIRRQSEYNQTIYDKLKKPPKSK